MTAALVILAVGVVALAALLVWQRRPDRIVAKQVRRDCVVTLKAGDTVKGILWAADPRVLVLRNVQALGDGEPVPVDGELIIHRADVLYVQLP